MVGVQGEEGAVFFRPGLTLSLVAASVKELGARIVGSSPIPGSLDKHRGW